MSLHPGLDFRGVASVVQVDGKPGPASPGVTSSLASWAQVHHTQTGFKHMVGRRQGQLSRATQLASGPGMKQNSWGLD